MTEMPSTPSQNPSGVSAARHAAVRDWPKYFDAVGDAGPRETCIRAADLFVADGPLHADDPPLAIDFGCGTGRDTIHLLAAGWRVLALDGASEAIDRLLARPEIAAHPDRLATGVIRFEDVRFPLCMLLNASYTLPFCPPHLFDALWERIKASIRPGGRFAGQFFGPEDDWAGLPDRTHHTRGQLDDLLADFELELCREDIHGPDPDTTYPKRWHIFDVVARRAE